MSVEGGTFSVARNVWGHPAFKSEPFTEREAWLWIVGYARYRRGPVRVGTAIIQAERAEVCCSLRFMAGAWKWSESKVRRYLKRLKKLEMITQKTDAGVTVITVCNYEKYQFPDALTDAGPTQDRRKEEERIKKNNYPPLPPKGGIGRSIGVSNGALALLGLGDDE